ncbi:malonyl CoA-acyl carrier protein transacylase [Enterococcus sp. JM4C]|uniref:ACP S-malonyltransferase n=1 Tax=Candidatus Enterococcus huntleyi TaxID=1857217 RepID=UPI00137B3332|nr:ACP S-malonyltransferase [Enterococcus sp. JM4C]KAF1296830.1 malonyl CoA-acyl carrier protein transacylase [Enterococcus sp. JM4C]
MKTAFLFSGQGAQYQGMGQSLYNTEAIVKETFEEASQALGYDMAKLCFEENPQLNQTEYTQPAILTVSVAFHRLLASENFSADIVAGLSLGEYSALVASGVLDFSAAVQLVSKRGKFMSEAAPSGIGKMVAVMNAPVEVIEECCQKASDLGIVAPANYNTPQQIVIGGEVVAVDEAMRLLKEAGIKRMIPLNVSGPFHTQLLEPAAKNLEAVLTDVSFSEPKIPIISNTTAKIMPYDQMKELLRRQVMSPVRFYESIETMKELGVTRVVEIGPGKVLSGFIKKIDSSIAISRVEDAETFVQTKEFLVGGN